MTTQQIKFDRKLKIRKKTGKHKKQSGPKDNKEAKYRGQGKIN